MAAKNERTGGYPDYVKIRAEIEQAQGNERLKLAYRAWRRVQEEIAGMPDSIKLVNLKTLSEWLEAVYSGKEDVPFQNEEVQIIRDVGELPDPFRSIADAETYLTLLGQAIDLLDKSWAYDDRLVLISQYLRKLQLRGREFIANTDGIDELLEKIDNQRVFLYESNREKQLQRMERESRDRQLSERMRAFNNMSPKEQAEASDRAYETMIRSLDNFGN